jgi:hypothetical protein
MTTLLLFAWCNLLYAVSMVIFWKKVLIISIVNNISWQSLTEDINHLKQVFFINIFVSMLMLVYLFNWIISNLCYYFCCVRSINVQLIRTVFWEKRTSTSASEVWWIFGGRWIGWLYLYVWFFKGIHISILLFWTTWKHHWHIFCIIAETCTSAHLTLRREASCNGLRTETYLLYSVLNNTTLALSPILLKPNRATSNPARLLAYQSVPANYHHQSVLLHEPAHC